MDAAHDTRRRGARSRRHPESRGVFVLAAAGAVISQGGIVMRPLIATVTSALLAAVMLGDAAAQATYRVPANAPANIKRAVESSARPAEQRARDADRKPAETLMLLGVAEGQRVVELAAFGHYWTNMLVDAVGASGQVTMVDMPWTDRFGGEAARA